ncbi:MAG: MarR family winged helix-turn-helix transcriptional regulator [Sandaracinobacteroides sp.]
MLTWTERALYALFTEIGSLEQQSRAISEKALPVGITLAQFGLLTHLAQLGGEWSPVRLARAFQVTKQTMTSTLARLEAAGLVAIRPDPADGRGKLVSLTAAGAAMQARCLQGLGPALALSADQVPAALVADLTPKLAELRALLDSVRG